MFFMLYSWVFLSCTQPVEDVSEEEIGKADVSAEISVHRSTGFLLTNPTVGPLLKTEWGQGGVWQEKTPLKDGEATYPGCTTVATAQILYYFQHQNFVQNDICYGLDYDLSGTDIFNEDTLCIDFVSAEIFYDWDKMAETESEDDASISQTADFLYHVGVTLNAQFGGGEGSSATGRQIENAFRYQWGYTKRRDGGDRARSVKVIMKDQFFDSDDDFAQHLRMELDAGRPVMYMAQQVTANTGHAFVIDGYDESSDLFHVNWGWGGRSNGYYDLSMTDPSGRSWSRNAMIYQYLEPTQDAGLAHIPTGSEAIPEYSWNGNGSLISYASGTSTGYGLTQDEAVIHPTSSHNPVVFFQWEIDARDGTNLLIKADEMSHATITYGPWNDRGKDVTHRHVPLPFILDPSSDGFSVRDQEYYVVAVRFDQKPVETTYVIAEITDVQGHTGNRSITKSFRVDGGVWHGNASVISYSSGTQMGYGLDRDEGFISTAPGRPPTFFAQWELDERDGSRMEISGPSIGAHIRYGLWDDRTQDIEHRNVTFPFVLDPSSDGLVDGDGTYFVVSIQFDDKPSQDEIIELKLIP
jgi:hypothetical protein